MPRPSALIPVLILTFLASLPLGAQGRSYEGRLRVDGRERTYLVDLPPRYDGRRALPLVLVFHGGGGNARQVRQQTGMSELARREGFIAVYPNGSGRLDGRILTWNAGTCCGYARQQRIDEVAFVRALLDSLQATLRIDPARVYATGMSNGGMMAHLVGCSLGGRIAAIGVVAGELTVPECRPPRPVAVVLIHGIGHRRQAWYPVAERLYRPRLHQAVRKHRSPIHPAVMIEILKHYHPTNRIEIRLRRVPALPALLEGIRYVFGNRWPRALMLLIAAFSIFGFSFRIVTTARSRPTVAPVTSDRMTKNVSGSSGYQSR